MNEIPNEIQWVVLCYRLRTLAQLRYCVYDLYIEGEFMFIEAKSCDDEIVNLTLTVDPEGYFL